VTASCNMHRNLVSSDVWFSSYASGQTDQGVLVIASGAKAAAARVQEWA